jgi:4-carboxymuconolactone decarboxylase
MRTIEMTTDTPFEQGLAMRKRVMGEAFVEKAFANTDAFTAPLQEFVTRNAWGTTWCRDGLDLKTRSLLTLSMLTALGRSHEIKGHVRGAINNGASTKEIQETLLHAAIYCGMPLAIDAFRSAHETLLELGCLNIEEASANADGGPKI